MPRQILLTDRSTPLRYGLFLSYRRAAQARSVLASWGRLGASSRMKPQFWIRPRMTCAAFESLNVRISSSEFSVCVKGSQLVQTPIRTICTKCVSWIVKHYMASFKVQPFNWMRRPTFRLERRYESLSFPIHMRRMSNLLPAKDCGELTALGRMTTSKDSTSIWNGHVSSANRKLTGSLSREIPARHKYLLVLSATASSRVSKDDATSGTTRNFHNYLGGVAYLGGAVFGTAESACRSFGAIERCRSIDCRQNLG